jgi:hypothetical protein
MSDLCCIGFVLDLYWICIGFVFVFVFVLDLYSYLHWICIGLALDSHQTHISSYHSRWLSGVETKTPPALSECE